MLTFLLHLLRLASIAAAIFFGMVTISLLIDGDILAVILAAVVTAIPVLIFWFTNKKLHKIAEAKAEEERWLTPEQFTLLVITEHEEDMDEQMEGVIDRLFEMDNLGSVSPYSIDEVRKEVPNFYVDHYPTYLIVDDSPMEDIGEMINNIRVRGRDAAPLLQFLQDELWKHELKLRAGKEAEDR